MKSKKAERIYTDTEAMVKRHVSHGTQFDSVHLEYGDDEIIYKKTVSGLMKIWEQRLNSLSAKARRYERRPEEAEKYPTLTRHFTEDVEVLRRMYLSIQNARRYAL